MSSEGDQPPGRPPKGNPQGTLLGFPQQREPGEPAPKPGPGTSSPRHPLPPPRSSRDSTAPPLRPMAQPRPPSAPPPAASPQPYGAPTARPSQPTGEPAHLASPVPHAPHQPPSGPIPQAPPAPPSGPIPQAPQSPASGPIRHAQPAVPPSSTMHGAHPFVQQRPPAPPAPPPAPAPASPLGEVPQPLSGPATAPSPTPGFPHYASGFGGSGPIPHGPQHTGPTQPYTEEQQHALPRAWVNTGDEPSPAMSIEEVPGSKFVSFLKISARRAFRLRIEPSEVLPSERDSLLAATPPIADPNLQSFLAWRRSVLFLVACALVPLSIIGLLDALAGTMATPIRFVRLAPAIAETVFAYVCWSQLRRWAHWRSQRRRLMWGWVLFMATPFIVFLYPLRTVFEDLVGSNRQDLIALGFSGAYRQAVTPFFFAMLAMLQLAPKAISLMPGLIRASLVIKLLFPGSSAPGWLMVIAAPLYALLAYVILVVPYQFTGSGWFIVGVLGVVAAQAVLARAGFGLARPLTEAETLVQVKRVRTYYLTVMTISGVMIVIALGSMVAYLNLRVADVITAVLKFEANVLILTMIGSDLVLANLDRARKQTAGKDAVEDEAELKIAAFVSLDAPHVPPPPGPAPSSF